MGSSSTAQREVIGWCSSGSAGTFTATNESYTAQTADSGLITIDGTTISFAGLEPIDDTLPAANFTFNAPAGQQSIEVVNGPTVGGFATTQIEAPCFPRLRADQLRQQDQRHRQYARGQRHDRPEQSDPGRRTHQSDDQYQWGDRPGEPGCDLSRDHNGREHGAGKRRGEPVDVEHRCRGTTLLDGGPDTDTLRFDAQNQPYTVTATTLTFNGQVVNFVNFEAVRISNAGGNPVVPVLPPLPINAIEGTQVIDVVVARFTDADFGAKAGDYAATIAWGDGTTSAGVVTQDASNPSLFYVTGTHLYRQQGACSSPRRSSTSARPPPRRLTA